ncbi:MAG: hypothetical protein FJW30_14425 [Acidobacteria bacterium]|nr:hypothetical protein [Acidobacteriota bacterium]
MSRLLAALLLLLLAAPTLFAQEPEYEMTTYQVAFLKTAPNRPDIPKDEAAKIQAAHMAHISAMAKSGKLILAGPFADGGALRGMFMFACGEAKAKQLGEADPAVKAGRLVLEWHPWYSAKGIGILRAAPGAAK